MANTLGRSFSGASGYRGPRNSLESGKCQEYLGIPDTSGCAQMSALLGRAHSQKGVTSLS